MTPRSGEQSKRTVLVADDEPGLAELYGAWLASDWDVRVARSGVEALSKFDDAVDVVILDQEMPELRGDEVAHRIRTTKSECSIGMVTSHEPELTILDWPLDEYVQKPVERESFRETVEQLACRTAFDAAVREYFALGSKLRSLDSTASRHEFRQTEAYRDSRLQLETLQDTAEAAIRRAEDPAPALVELLHEFCR